MRTDGAVVSQQQLPQAEYDVCLTPPQDIC